MQLRSLVSQIELNKNVDLEIERGGKPMKLTAQIKEQPGDYLTRAPRQNQPQQPNEPDNEPPPSGGNAESDALTGIQVSELTPDLARQLDLPNGVHGVVVTDVDPRNGVAELQKGDVIEELNQQPVASVADYRKVVGAIDPKQPQVLSVCRHRVRSFVVVRPR
jgi:serine protease Do